MKIGKIPVVSLILLVVCLSEFVVKRFYPAKYPTLEPAFTGFLVTGIVLYLAHHGRIWVTAWMNNRKEESVK